MIGRFVSGRFGGGSAPQVPNLPAVDPVAQEIAEMGAAVDSLRSVVRRAGSKLPPLLMSQLRHLGDLMQEAVADISVRGCSTEQRVLLNAMITSYVPTPLQAYLALPSAHHDEESRATFMFAEQLATLEETLADLLNQIRIGAVEELSTHGRFLADKFSAQDVALQLQQPAQERDPLHLEGQRWQH
jgi:hypothetical protein